MPPRAPTPDVRIGVRRGSVRLAGTFHDPADVLFLKHRGAEVDGVVDLQIVARLEVSGDVIGFFDERQRHYPFAGRRRIPQERTAGVTDNWLHSGGG
jgi:hypothetical protein